MFACLYRPSATEDGALVALAEEFSPRYERHGRHAVSLDVGGLGRLIGTPRQIGDELAREARARCLQVHIGIAATRTAAALVAHACPGVTVVPDDQERRALAPLSIGVLRFIAPAPDEGGPDPFDVLTRWGIRTLGQLASIEPSELASRLGQRALAWHVMARGEDARPLVPAVAEERFEASLELEWPIDTLEPLSFILTRLLEPIVVRLERRDRGAAAIVTTLRLITRDTIVRRIELPTPLRDVRALRTLALLDLEAHPPDTSVDVVSILIEPTPGRILQHTLFTKPHPTPEQLSTLVARLYALMGRERVGCPTIVDTFCPGAFGMEPLELGRAGEAGGAGEAGEQSLSNALRRCRRPVPVRVTVEAGRPVRVSIDRSGYVSGHVVRAAGPWHASGHWWEGRPSLPHPPSLPYFAQEQWDLEVTGGAVYRVFRDEPSQRWFLEGIYD